MQRRLLDVMTVVVVVCAVASTWIAARGALHSAGTEASPVPTVSTISDWRRIASNGRVIGNSQARVVVTEFADFECPGCKMLAPSLLKLMKDRHPDVALSVLHFPLRYHAAALPAARAADCAAEQGRFGEYYEALYAADGGLANIRFDSLATEVGVPDLKAFTACVADSAVKRRIDANIALGRSLKISGTPTIMINGMLLAHPPSERVMDSLVTIALSTDKRDVQR